MIPYFWQRDENTQPEPRRECSAYVGLGKCANTFEVDANNYDFCADHRRWQGREIVFTLAVFGCLVHKQKVGVRFRMSANEFRQSVHTFGCNVCEGGGRLEFLGCLYEPVV